MSGNESGAFREKLGERLVFWGSIGLIALGITVIVGAAVANANNPEGDAILQAAQLVFTAILPLIGTWVGTILAFFYTRENFKDAAQSQLDLARLTHDKLVSKPIRDQMIPKSQIVSVIANAGNVNAVPIGTIGATFAKNGVNGRPVSRIVFLSETGVACGVLHKSTWNAVKVAAMEAKQILDEKATAESVLDLPCDRDPGKTFLEYIRATMSFVRVDGTMADAKLAMQSVSGCQDAFVTQSGRPEEAVLGWLTDSEVLRATQS